MTYLFLKKVTADINSHIAYPKPLISLLSHKQTTLYKRYATQAPFSSLQGPRVSTQQLVLKRKPKNCSKSFYKTQLKHSFLPERGYTY